MRKSAEMDNAIPIGSQRVTAVQYLVQSSGRCVYRYVRYH